MLLFLLCRCATTLIYLLTILVLWIRKFPAVRTNTTWCNQIDAFPIEKRYEEGFLVPVNEIAAACGHIEAWIWNCSKRKYVIVTVTVQWVAKQAEGENTNKHIIVNVVAAVVGSIGEATLPCYRKKKEKGTWWEHELWYVMVYGIKWWQLCRHKQYA